MIGYQLTEEQKDLIQGQYYAPYQFFNCVLSIDNVWFLFLSDEDKAVVSTTEWDWILTLLEGQYVPPPSPPFPPCV